MLHYIESFVKFKFMIVQIFNLGTASTLQTTFTVTPCRIFRLQYMLKYDFSYMLNLKRGSSELDFSLNILIWSNDLKLIN